MTTVGYGDFHPSSVTGRTVAMIVMFFGIGFLSMRSGLSFRRLVRSRVVGKRPRRSARRWQERFERERLECSAAHTARNQRRDHTAQVDPDLDHDEGLLF